MLSPRNPDSSQSGAISVASVGHYNQKFLIPALLASGFRQKDGNDKILVPCPLGTFTDPSAKGEGGCQNCPPGNLLLLHWSYLLRC